MPHKTRLPRTDVPEQAESLGDTQGCAKEVARVTGPCSSAPLAPSSYAIFEGAKLKAKVTRARPTAHMEPQPVWGLGQVLTVYALVARPRGRSRSEDKEKRGCLCLSESPMG